MSGFVSGLELNRRFYGEAVRPLLGRVPHAAARLGTGSDVLGYDSERSVDHGWGPRLVVCVEDDDVVPLRRAVDEGLPETFEAWPVRFGWDDVAVTHHVEITTLGSWLRGQLGVDASVTITPQDWLVIPQQKLLEVTEGEVYHDDKGDLHRVREKLAWYPDDVWVWLIAAQWRRIAQEEPFVGRTAEARDELGSRLVTARLARELMRLWFLFSRTYWPYTKWFGSAFARLGDSGTLGEALAAAVSADSYPAREEALVAAYEVVANRHNDVGVSATVDPAVRRFHSRPYLVLMADRFADACLERLDGSPLRHLPLVGSVDQVADSTDVLSYPPVARRVRSVYSADDDQA